MPPPRTDYGKPFDLKLYLGLPAACLAAVALGSQFIRLVNLPARVDAQERILTRLINNDEEKTKQIQEIRSAIELQRIENNGNWSRNERAQGEQQKLLQAIVAGVDLQKDRTTELSGRVAAAYEKSANALTITDEHEARLREVEIKTNGNGK